MERKTSDRLADRNVATDLKAAISARRELDPEMEDHVVDAFLARVEDRIDVRVAEQLAQQGSRAAKQDQGKIFKINPTELIATSFGIAVPLLVIAGIFGHAVGIIAVVVGVVLVNTFFILAAVNENS